MSGVSIRKFLCFKLYINNLSNKQNSLKIYTEMIQLNNIRLVQSEKGMYYTNYILTKSDMSCLISVSIQDFQGFRTTDVVSVSVSGERQILIISNVNTFADNYSKILLRYCYF